MGDGEGRMGVVKFLQVVKTVVTEDDGCGVSISPLLRVRLTEGSTAEGSTAEGSVAEGSTTEGSTADGFIEETLVTGVVVAGSV